MATWKHVERQIAKLLGGRRLGPTGERQPDVVTDWLAVEVKHGADLIPQWLMRAVVQSRVNARVHSDEKRLPIVVLHQKYWPYDDSFVVLRLGDWLEWFGGGGKRDLG